MSTAKARRHPAASQRERRGEGQPGRGGERGVHVSEREREERERDLPLPPSASPRRLRRPPNSPWIPRAEVSASTGHFPSPPLPSFSAAAAGSIRAIGGFRPPGAAAVARRGVGFPSRARPASRFRWFARAAAAGWARVLAPSRRPSPRIRDFSARGLGGWARFRCSSCRSDWFGRGRVWFGWRRGAGGFRRRRRRRGR